MIKHIDIECRSISLKPGFGFDIYKFATENQLTGQISYPSHENPVIHLEGSENSVAAFINWCLKNMETSGITEFKIRNGPVQNFGQFTLGNRTDH